MTSTPTAVPTPIGVGIIGMGFMGWQHATAYAAAVRDGYHCHITAICDPDETRHTQPATADAADPPPDILPASTSAYDNADDLLADPSVQLVSICTHTDSHVDLAIRAINAGKHVLVEKPVALDAKRITPLVTAARNAATLVMPAHCMRFWPGWDWLREAIISQQYGKALSATFQRVGPPPSWSTNFYTDTARSGGALTDLHIHDADFIQWVFGEPQAVCCTGNNHHTTTLYRYPPDHPHAPSHITAEAGWTRSTTAGFAMRYNVDFEHATAEFDSSRTDNPLRLSDGSGKHNIQLPPGTGYDHQARHIIDAIAQHRVRATPKLRVTINDALATAAMLDAERTSLTTSQGWVTHASTSTR